MGGGVLIGAIGARSKKSNTEMITIEVHSLALERVDDSPKAVVTGRGKLWKGPFGSR